MGRARRNKDVEVRAGEGGVPEEMSTMISRIANASARTVRANAAVRKERERNNGQ